MNHTGKWDSHKLDHWHPELILQKLKVILPLRPEHGEDKFLFAGINQ